MARNPVKIPTFYRVAFVMLDPLIAGSGVYMHLFAPAEVLNSFVPASIAPYNPFYGFFQHQLAAALFFCIILDLFLLRKTDELWIWDPIQSGQFLWDVIMVASQIYSIKQQRRLTLQGMRPEDWGSLAITGGIGLVRLGFLTRIGMAQGHKGQKKS